jgi:long-subunit acyl-CoA synthetase (AMP-forming)
MTPWYQSDLTGGIGSLLPNCRLKIVGEDGEEVAEGKEGEILVKGPIVTRGYWRNEVATKGAFAKNGWLKTGDIGLRRDGIFYIVDRKKVCARLGTCPALPLFSIIGLNTYLSHKRRAKF